MIKFLIVDDEVKIREVAKEYAKASGLIADEASDGQEAIDKVKEEDYDVVVLDIMMPNLDGFTACREIKKIKDVPIIITDSLRLATFEWLNAQEWLTKKGATPATKKAVTKTELIQYYNVNQTLVADITSDRNVIRDRVRPF